MRLRHVDGFVVLTVVILFLAGLAAHAQTASSGVQPINGPSYSVPDHPMHASQGDLRPEQSLFGSNAVTVAQGERPMSDFPADRPYVKPLGDVAREYREEAFRTRGHSGSGRSPDHSHVYWEQQGSAK